MPAYLTLGLRDLQDGDGGRFNPEHGDYVNFHATIKAGMPATQTPNFFTLGPVAAFSKQRPFTI